MLFVPKKLVPEESFVLLYHSLVPITSPIQACGHVIKVNIITKLSANKSLCSSVNCLCLWYICGLYLSQLDVLRI